MLQLSCMAFAANSKLARIRKAMAADDWELAIRLAAKFPSLGEQAADLRRANDAMNNPQLYRQLGHDLQEIREKGVAALKVRFSKSWQSVERFDKRDSMRSNQKGGSRGSM